MPRFRLTLEYDGSGFAGWQVQSGGQRTVQGALEDALFEVTGQHVRVAGAGRTDAGVHAEAQVASVELETDLDPATLLRALNARLPRDLAVVAAQAAATEFHARFSASGKLYRYQVWNGETRSPLREARWHAVRGELGVAAMRAAARRFEGEHDFAALQAAGSGVKDTVRELRRLEIHCPEPGEMVFDVEGSGFLRHMVRSVVGTLLEVGLGRRTPESIPALLASRDRARAGPTAPAAALTLVRVFYPD